MSKELVNDYDRHKGFITTWVWICNKCPNKKISDELPEEWEEENLFIDQVMGY